ncbi:MAG: hypothetical protein MUO87_03190 [Thermoplasmata archaeon]|nr:hypothetical protein [Thermoplasmata archaeon]
MKLLTGRWLKRTIALVLASTIILIGIVLTIEILEIGSDFLEEKNTPYILLIVAIGAITAGTLLLVKFNVEPDPSKGGSSSIRVNVLCLMGAFLGFFCMLEWGWASGGYSVPYPDRIIYMQIDWAFRPPIEYFASGEVYSWLFVVGTVLAFFTPLAGYLQLCGVTVFAFDLHDTLNGPAGSGSWDASGFVVAIVATSIVLMSLAFPYGVGYKGRLIDLPGRILTVSSPAFAEKITRWRHHRIRHLRSTDSHQ